jgi:Kdo2-lipid IVA lauroyltransferase/acyltransferase
LTAIETMNGTAYSFRRKFFARERSYEIDTEALRWNAGQARGSIKYDQVKEVRLYQKSMAGDAVLNKQTMWDIHLSTGSDRLVLSRLHYVRLGTWEDRSNRYRPFADVLLSRLQACNPELKIAARPHWTLRLRRDLKSRVSAIGERLLILLLPLVRGFNPTRAADVAGRLMRAIGPFLRAHRVARANLRAAFNDKSEREIEQILRGMWDNFGRVMAEYAALDRVWDYEQTDSGNGRIVIGQTFAETMRRLHASGRPALLFGAHLANWELLPIVPAAFGVKSAMVYRPPDSRAVAEVIMGQRAKMWGSLIPARPGAALDIRRALRRRACVGMVVDQHSAGGVEVSFFGRPCTANPALARLARKFDCPVFGARAIRLSHSRYRLELTDALTLPRDRDGKVDIAATTQMITSIIEQWIREHPEQWLWMHRRWR